MLTALAGLLEVPAHCPPAAGDGSDQSYLMVLAGLTSAADGVGSNKAFFPEVGTEAVAGGRFVLSITFGGRSSRPAKPSARSAGRVGQLPPRRGWLPSCLRI